MNLTIDEIEKKASAHRETILKTINNMGKGHVGGAFSCIDILSSLYYGGLLDADPNNFVLGDSSRDRMILSKGHASIAHYVILQELGFFDEHELSRMNNGGILGEHPDPSIPGIEFVSGSLGHGLGVGIGFALASRIDGYDSSTYIVLGDGECYEGSIWEAAMLGAHLRLTNLVAVVDRNRLCIHGDTEAINALEPMSDKWKAFGWNVLEVNGHDIEELMLAFKTRHSLKPTVIIAGTTKGKGVSFMEGKPCWHHGGIDDEILNKALGEVKND